MGTCTPTAPVPPLCDHDTSPDETAGDDDEEEDDVEEVRYELCVDLEAEYCRMGGLVWLPLFMAVHLFGTKKRHGWREGCSWFHDFTCIPINLMPARWQFTYVVDVFEDGGVCLLPCHIGLEKFKMWPSRI